MKCERHPEEDALGICMVCGRGVCEACRVIYRGVVLCAHCMTEGRLAGALEREFQPRPRGSPSYWFFRGGMLGAAILFLDGLLVIGFRSANLAFPFRLRRLWGPWRYRS